MKWTLEKLQEEANKYKTIGEYQKENGSSYNAARRLNILYDLFKNHINNGHTKKQKISGYWTLDNLQIEANKYENRMDFRQDKAAYGAAKRKKVLNIIFKNHINSGYTLNENWSNNYCIYVYELEKYNKAYVGLTNNIKKRDLNHLYNINDSISIFCKKENIAYPNYKILESNLTSIEAKNKEDYWLNYYKNNEWDMFNKSKPGSLGNIKIIWTKKALQKEANKYNTRFEFAKNNSSAYSVSCSKKIIDDLFKNHPNNGYKNKYGYWSLENLQKEVDKYETRYDFYKNCHGGYVAAVKIKILNDLFKNHPNNGYKKKV